ncbi:glycosyltransferase family 4 protein [uncultured Zoogloea sp.]|uniref:glycosyltransferase family 4 protein n=1 Tax=uncultured Zoogloea sp. TaxID=160237 RepID=UPI00263346E7|nr:glycosyltransferase family 4 protein [uncultured Zoogloea sp.]
MRIALIADAYPPMRSSGAVQLRDLSREFVRQGHDITVIVPAAELATPWSIEILAGVQVLRVKAMQTRDTNYAWRTLAELALSHFVRKGLLASPLRDVKWDAVVWYSPTIFFGRAANWLKVRSACPSYLIIRDIFPEWAVDLGLMRRGPVYRFFKYFERLQYESADTIGVQSPAGLSYFADWAAASPGRRLEVLQNWLAPAENVGCSIDISKTHLAGRHIFVYAGNMGAAQAMDMVLALAERLMSRTDVGFLFVGRGSDVPRLRAIADEKKLPNVLFYDEIDPTEVPGLLIQCHVGLVMLDPRHKTHNVPGKFLTYMQAGLPVLARLNAGNDLVEQIEDEGVGRAYVGDSVDAFGDLGISLANSTDRDRMSKRAVLLSDRLYSVRAAVHQITSRFI